jgi:hypothetical protein
MAVPTTIPTLLFSQMVHAPGKFFNALLGCSHHLGAGWIWKRGLLSVNKVLSHVTKSRFLQDISFVNLPYSFRLE